MLHSKSVAQIQLNQLRYLQGHELIPKHRCGAAQVPMATREVKRLLRPHWFLYWENATDLFLELRTAQSLLQVLGFWIFILL